MAATVTPRSEQKRLDDPELERLLVNWQRWRVGDPGAHSPSEVSVESGLDPDRMDRAGSGMQRRYHETYVPVLVRDAIIVEQAINGLPEEYANCLVATYLLMPWKADDAIAKHLSYGSRQTYYRRLDDAKIMVKTRIYAQRRHNDRHRRAAETAANYRAEQTGDADIRAQQDREVWEKVKRGGLDDVDRNL